MTPQPTLHLVHPNTDRRSLASRRALRARLLAEFVEMPGLRVTLRQASRLFALRADICRRVLGELVDGDQLWLAADAHYGLRPAERAAHVERRQRAFG
jgi:hypothetical protein